MKKVFLAMMVCVLAGVLASCSSNSPRSVAEKSLDCIIHEDYRGYFDCVYFPEDKKEEKEGYIAMIEEKVKKNTESGKASTDQKMVSYKFISEEINEEAGVAKEIFEVTYDNGSTKQETVDLKKEEDGKWYVKMKK